mgnify:CR=1 FL=1
MNALPVLAAAALVAAGTSYAVVTFASGGQASERRFGEPPTEEEAQLSSLARRLEEAEARLDKLQETKVALPAEGRTSVDDEAIARAVEAWFARNPQQLGAPNEASAKGQASKKAPTSDELWARFVNGELEPHMLGEAWKDASQEERKAMLAKFEQYAKERPNDADAQYAYGQAICQRLMDAPVIEQARLGPLSDKIFDKALAIDPEHWSARFSKAMSLSFWPDVLGKRPEAIKNFEVLIEQQERKSPKPQFEQSYLTLGNLHAQQGKVDEARKVWQRGLQLFPGSKAIADALAGLGN